MTGIRRSQMLAAVTLLCLAATASRAQTAPLPEIQVSTYFILDFEFDSGRDGVYCPTCNFGAGNNRLTFTDPLGHLWIGNVDQNTGAFVPVTGRGVQAGINAAYAAVFGNGPEWVMSAEGAQIVYTYYVVGTPKNADGVSLGLATQTATGWTSGQIPGTQQRYLPLGSLDPNDPSARIAYQNKATGKAYWRDLDESVPEQAVPTKGTCGRRFVNGRPTLVYTSPCLFRTRTKSQVYALDLSTNVAQQVTFDDTAKDFAFMWRAPEFDNDYALLTVADLSVLRIYREIDDGSGGKTWVLANSITPLPDRPYIGSPEPFVHNGKSYVVMSVSTSSDPNDVSVPTQIALTGIDPATPSFRLLTNDDSIQRLRLDPEYYITSQGPFIYYNRYLPGASISTIQNEGVWRVDTGLGPPVH